MSRVVIIVPLSQRQKLRTRRVPMIGEPDRPCSLQLLFQPERERGGMGNWVTHTHSHAHTHSSTRLKQLLLRQRSCWKTFPGSIMARGNLSMRLWRLLRKGLQSCEHAEVTGGLAQGLWKEVWGLSSRRRNSHSKCNGNSLRATCSHPGWDQCLVVIFLMFLFSTYAFRKNNFYVLL